MAITVDHLKFFASERMTDNSDGGGQMTAIEIVSGDSNNIFDDLSEVDRASGDVSIRKVFAAVTSADTDKYLDAGVTIFAPPEDADTTCLGFSTGDFYDERAALADAVGQYRARGIDTKLRLIGNHVVNQRTLYGYMLKPVAKEPATLFYNAVLSVASEANDVISQEQFVQVMRVTVSEVQYTYLVNDIQTLFDVYEVVLDLTGPLQYLFEGAVENASGAYTPPTIIRTTSVIAPYLYCGVTALATTAALGATTIELDDTKALLAPMDYQDLGDSSLDFPSGTRQMVLTAPDGFFLTAIIPGSVNLIAYRYGGEWIATGDPNAALYVGGTISFPLRPDAGSSVFVRYVNVVGFVEESFTHASVQTAITVTSLNTPLLRGGLQIKCTIYPPSGGYNLTLDWTADNGNGAFVSSYFIGTVNYATGAVTLTLLGSWASYYVLTNSVVMRQATSSVTTEWAELLPAPVLIDSVVVRAVTEADGDPLEGTDDGAGAIVSVDDVIVGTVDYITGLLEVTFAEAVVESATSVSYRLGGYLPQPANLLGIDAVRLPKDGRMPIFTDNQLALIHHTDTVVEAALSPSEEIDCGRTSLYRVTIDDVAGQRLPASFYSVDRALGTVTMSPTLDLTGYSGNYTIYHTIADLRRINRVSHSLKTLTLTLGLSRQFVADETLVSSVLFIGTMQARYSNLFAQSTWTSVWSDSLIGSEPLAQYNDTLYPIDVSNLGAYTDRILVKFTSATAFQVIGENLGLIAIGDTNADCAPVNSLTGQPYFTIDYRGWGAGWATGNCLRFNLIGANYPIDLIRSVQPSAPTGLEDSVELLFLGNVDAP